MSDVIFADDPEDTYDTLDEAIAAAFAESAEGDEVAVHSPNCTMGLIDEDGEHMPCTCTPVVHVVERGQA